MAGAIMRGTGVAWISWFEAIGRIEDEPYIPGKEQAVYGDWGSDYRCLRPIGVGQATKFCGGWMSAKGRPWRDEDKRRWQTFMCSSCKRIATDWAEL